MPRVVIGLAVFAIGLVSGCGGDGATAAASNPLPVLLSVTPTVLNAGSSGATLEVKGESFVRGSRVLWDGSERPTRFVGSMVLEFDVSANDLAAMDTVPIVVVNPSPGGGSSAFQAIVVGYPTPVITSVSPSTFAIGPLSVALTITGTGFSNHTLVIWDAETAGFVANVMSPTQLRVQIPSFEYPAARQYQIYVHNIGPGGGNSNLLPVVVSAKSTALGGGQ